MTRFALHLLIPLATALLPGPAAAQFAPDYVPLPHQLDASRLAVVVNESSELSATLGAYYKKARHVPERNIIRVRIPGSPKVLSRIAFEKISREIDSKLGPGIDAILMIWTAPYAVECNSITYAVTFGFDPEVCRDTCGPSKPSPIFDAATLSAAPGRHTYRLAMLLPTQSLVLGRELIDRGVASDQSMPFGRAYFLHTSDPVRNTRSPFFPRAGLQSDPHIRYEIVSADSIQNKRDVMFYFTGAEHVDHLETLRFLPGAVADHLTSYGGDLLGGNQMSSLKWIEAGVTATYGTVSEPCNHWQKFPNPSVLLRHYLTGETVIEAYWKSVAWPAQGLFIGEPLAAPFRRPVGPPAAN